MRGLGVTELVHRVDQRFGWHRLPTPLAILSLRQMRVRLRSRNLHDTGRPQTPAAIPPAGAVRVRTIDGTWTTPDDPAMGAAGSRFARNVPLDDTWPETEPRLSTPSVRRVSLELLTRERFEPAPILNLLAAAWLQFEVHDWFSHGPSEMESPISVELDADDPWHEHPMLIERTRPDPAPDPGRPQTWTTLDSHWWDASQLYGRVKSLADRRRAFSGGRLRVDDGLLPDDLSDGLDLRDVYGNHWLGLELLETVFTLEHNSICDRLRSEHPTWDDERLYQTARLVNAALLAKIHTVDWTPAILPHPATARAMHAQWWGLQGERLTRRFGRLTRSEVLSGIPGSPTALHDVPYALTEEFVSVYRMHPLMPDEFVFHSPVDGALLAEHEFPELNALHARERLGELSVENVLYSFGTSRPGALQLHNFPRFLQRLERPDGTIVDLAAIDILRSRERGVPRYARFRELFHMRPIRTFEDITPNRRWQEELDAVYNGDVGAVDLTVGLFAEAPPHGFGFSDTAFRVFILMASRRLNSDPFFTSDFREEVYTAAGMRWILDNDFRSVLLRHFPRLAPALAGVSNPFAPWRVVGTAPGRAREQAAASPEPAARW
jgi:hypothetical protein